MEKDLKIFKSKTLADGSKYFSLFEKHIPALNAGSTVYLYMIGNLHCICEIIKKNPNAKYFIHDSDEVINAVQIVMDNIDISKTVDLYDIDMKFDCVIMNPPYQRNLHLKILAEAIKHLKDKTGICVNLSPDDWITDPFKEFSKDKFRRSCVNDIAPKIFEHESFDVENTNKMFGINSFFGVGIIALRTSYAGFDVSKYNTTNELYKKVLSKLMSMPSIRSKQTRKSNQKFFVVIRRRSHGYLDWCDASDVNNPSKDGIEFLSKTEELNFRKSILNTFLYKWLIKDLKLVNSEKAPWLGDAINPRTGLKGYTGEWTDADLYKYFNITPEEQKVIEDTMAKYVK